MVSLSKLLHDLRYYGNLQFLMSINAQIENLHNLYCHATADILTNLLQKCSSESICQPHKMYANYTIQLVAMAAEWLKIGGKYIKSI